MDFSPIYEEDDNLQGNEAVIHLVLDDDTEMECVIIAVFPIQENEQEYIALLPISEDLENEEESDVLLYRYAEDESGELLLDNIESDEEYDAAAQAFYNVIDEMMDEEPAE